jgi:hypothetical protein
MVAIKEAPKTTKHRKTGIKSLTPIDTILFFIIYPIIHGCAAIIKTGGRRARLLIFKKIDKYKPGRVCWLGRSRRLHENTGVGTENAGDDLSPPEKRGY